MSEENIVTGEGFLDDWDFEYKSRIAEQDAEIARLEHRLSEALYLLNLSRDALSEWEDDDFSGRRSALLQGVSDGR